MTSIEGLLYCASLLMVLTYFGMALQRSEFGLVLLTYDLPFFLGCCVYPLLLGASLITPGIEGRAALSSLGMPGTLTAVHVLALAGGTFLGYLIGRTAPTQGLRRWERLAKFLVPDTMATWRFLVIAGLTTIVAFMLIVGVEVALVNAALARSGVVEGFEEDVQWLFLKRIAGLFGLVYVFVPAVLMLGKERVAFFVVYLVLIALLYLNSISRVLLVHTLVLPLMIYLYMSKKLFKPWVIFLLPAIAMFVAFVVVYGKGIGALAAAIFGNGMHFELTEHQSEVGIAGALGALLRNMEGQWYSIAAGIKHFAEHGPFIPPDIVVSTIGFVPSRLLDWVGLGAFHYSNIEPKLACVNNSMLGLDGCSLPPFNAGYSAYFVPVAGGFIFALIRTWFYGKLETTWTTLRARSVGLLWLPILAAHVVATFFSFIPPMISAVIFMILVVGGYAVFKLVAERLPSLRSV